MTFSIGLRSILLLVAVVCILGCDDGNTTTGFRMDSVEGGSPAKWKQPDEITEKGREFFVAWLKEQGEKNIVNDKSGVGVAENATRLWAFLYKLDEGENGVTAEIEFRVVLEDGREIQDFVAANGETKEKAIGMAFMNYTLSTFHSVYACFINENDEHVKHDEIVINGNKMLYTTLGVYALGGEDLKAGSFDSAKQGIKRAIETSKLSNQVHWIKVVYGKAEGKTIAASTALDNKESAELTQKTESFGWPATTSFYLAKQFVIVRPDQ